jgi:hypothetical protein
MTVNKNVPWAALDAVETNQKDKTGAGVRAGEWTTAAARLLFGRPGLLKDEQKLVALGRLPLFGLDEKKESAPREGDKKPKPEEKDTKDKPDDPIKKYFDITKAKIAKVKNPTDKGKDADYRPLKAGETLESGDYRIRFENGREAMIHVPPLTKEEKGKPLPVMFVIPGVSNRFQKPDNYLAETNILDATDKLPDKTSKGEVQQKMMVVTLLTENYQLGEATDPKSTVKAWAWNAPYSLRHQDDVDAHTKVARNNDFHYTQGMMNLVGQLGNPRKDRESWGFLAASQGAAFLNSFVCSDEKGAKDVRNIFLVAGTMEDKGGKPEFKVPDGRKLWVTIYHHGNDEVLPDKGNPDREKILQKARKVADLVGLKAVNNGDQDPDKHRRVYTRNLGTSKEYVLKGYVSSNPAKTLKTTTDFDKELSAKEAEEELKLATEGNGKAKRQVVLTYRIKDDPDGHKGSVDYINLFNTGHLVTGPDKGSTSWLKRDTSFFEGKDATERLRRIVALIDAGKIKRDLRD